MDSLQSKCAWLTDHNRCDILINRKNCSINSCSFYTIPKRLIESQEKAYERLCSLSYRQQEDIADKYYKGLLPWQKEDYERDC